MDAELREVSPAVDRSRGEVHASSRKLGRLTWHGESAGKGEGEGAAERAANGRDHCAAIIVQPSPSRHRVSWALGGCDEVHVFGNQATAENPQAGFVQAMPRQVLSRARGRCRKRKHPADDCPAV